MQQLDIASEGFCVFYKWPDSKAKDGKNNENGGIKQH